MSLLKGLTSLFIISFSSVLSAQESVATVSPVSYSFSQAMLKGTKVQVDYLPPKRLPMSRIPSWLHKHQTNKFKRYDAFVTISSIVPGLDFFNSLRQTNIRITRIDMATAMLPKGEKVSLHSDKEYFWLNNNNLLLMLGVLKRDFALMWPENKTVIDKNYQTLSAKIRQLNLSTDALIQQHEVAFITSSNERLTPLGSSFSSDFVSVEEANMMGLKFVEVTARKKADLTSQWQIDDFTKVKEDGLLNRLQRNSDNLKQLLIQ